MKSDNQYHSDMNRIEECFVESPRKKELEKAKKAAVKTHEQEKKDKA